MAHTHLDFLEKELEGEAQEDAQEVQALESSELEPAKKSSSLDLSALLDTLLRLLEQRGPPQLYPAHLRQQVLPLHEDDSAYVPSNSPSTSSKSKQKTT